MKNKLWKANLILFTKAFLTIYFLFVFINILNKG